MRTARECGVYCGEQVVLASFELSSTKWRLCFGANGRQRQVSIDPGDGDQLTAAVDRARIKLGLPADAAVVSCYEAGRDAFWVHRWLEQRGIRNVVIDSASIEVSRRARQAKTDRLDAESLLRLLQRWYGGEHRALRVVRVPEPGEEDGRVLGRERDSWVKRRTQSGNRLKGLLAAQGVRVAGPVAEWGKDLGALRTGDGRELPPDLRARLVREIEQYLLITQTVRALEREQRQRLVASNGTGPSVLVQLLMNLRGIGLQSAWALVHEAFAWRRYRNRRELAASVGLVPTPFDSGQTRREQGISKSGSRRLRRMLIELAWMWLRHQPDSALSQWWRRRFADGVRSRKVGIVALARKLLIGLWELVSNGSVPAGARLKPAC